MAYTTPRTWVAGEYPTAAQLNANVRDNVSFLANPPTVRVKNSGAFSHTSSGNWMQITWNQEDWDSTGSMHSTSSNQGRLVAPIAGKYRVYGLVRLDGNTTGVRALRILHNAVNEPMAASKLATDAFAGVQFLDLFTEMALAASDYVELGLWQDSGGTRTVSATQSHFGMSWFSL